MADYTYSQLSQMQQEAARRVMEMRRRAKFAAEDAAKQFDAPQSTPEPVQQMQEAEEPACRECGNLRCSKRRMHKNESALLKNNATPEEADRALLLSLCFLLQAEKADEELLLAMLYVLT